MKKYKWGSDKIILPLFLAAALAFSMVISIYNYRGNLEDIQTQTGNVLAQETVTSIENSLRFGKQLDNYYGMEEILQELLDHLEPGSKTAVVDSDGAVLYAAGGEILNYEDCIKIPIEGAEQEASLLLELSLQGQEHELQGIIKTVGVVTGITALAGILLFGIGRRFIKEKMTKAFFLLIAFIGVVIQGGASLQIYQNGYQTAMYREAEIILTDLNDNISSVMEQGVSLKDTTNLDEYLAERVENIPILWNLRVVESYADTSEITGNENELVRSYRLGEEEIFIQAELSMQYIDSKVQELFWILLSTLIIIIIFIFELFRLPFVLRYRFGPMGRSCCPQTYENISETLRILSFLCSTAEYLCVPYAAMLIRQSESTILNLSVGMTAALPIMVEGIMQTIAMLILPVLSKKSSGKKSISLWAVLMVGTNILAFFGTSAWQWIACRAIAGFAYGGFKEVANLIITCGYDTPERRSQNLAADNAGLLAGTTCGAGLGAIVASAVGLSGTYLVSSVLFAIYGAAALAVVPWQLLTERKQSLQRTDTESFHIKKLKNLIVSKSLWSYILLAVVPLNIGVILIVSLIPALCQKWEISMIILSYCYIVNGMGGIYFGPWLLKKFRGPLGLKKCIGVILLVLAASLAVLKIPAAAALLVSSFLLGFFDGFGTPTTSDGFMELEVIKRNLNEQMALMLFMILCCVLNSAAPVVAELIEPFF